MISFSTWFKLNSGYFDDLGNKYTSVDSRDVEITSINFAEIDTYRPLLHEALDDAINRIKISQQISGWKRGKR